MRGAGDDTCRRSSSEASGEPRRTATHPRPPRVPVVPGRVLAPFDGVRGDGGSRGQDYSGLGGLGEPRGLPARDSRPRRRLGDAFGAPERAGDLEKIESAEVLYAPGGENRALLLVGWLASTLGWKPEGANHNGDGRNITFSGPSGGVSVALSPDSPDARLRRIRLYSEEYSFQVSRHRELSDVRTTVMRGEELLAERTVHLGSFDLGVLVGEELRYRGRDEAYESALRAAVEILEL